MQIKLLTLGITTLAMVAWAQSNQYPNQNRSQKPSQDQNQTYQNQAQDPTQPTTTEKRTDTKTADKTTPTKTYKGMLVDANCNPATAQSSTTASKASSSADRSTTDQSATTGKSAGMSHGKSEWQSCPATASTTSFGLVLPDGRMVKFDDVGNSRASSEIKSNSKLTTGNKPASVKVRGTLEGETLVVTDIH